MGQSVRVEYTSSLVKEKKNAAKTIFQQTLGEKFPNVIKDIKLEYLKTSTCPKEDKYKEMEENNRMGKTRDFFNKIRDTKGTFHAKMGTVKDRNGMDLTEAERLRKGGQNTQRTIPKRS